MVLFIIHSFGFAILLLLSLIANHNRMKNTVDDQQVDDEKDAADVER